MSVNEQIILLDFIKNDQVYSQYLTLVSLMLGTGCRIGETLGITWDDIDFENELLNIDHQLIYKKKDGKIQYYTSLPKNKEKRVIPLQKNLLSILQEYKRNNYFQSKASSFKVDGYTNFVFLNRGKKVPTPHVIVRAFHGIVNAYNKIEQEKAIDEKRNPVLLPDFSPHTLRHTFCTRMAENGIDVKVLQTIMGHKDIAVTMQVYNHVDVCRLKTAVAGTRDILVHSEC